VLAASPPAMAPPMLPPPIIVIFMVSMFYFFIETYAINLQNYEKSLEKTSRKGERYAK